MMGSGTSVALLACRLALLARVAWCPAIGLAQTHGDTLQYTELSGNGSIVGALTLWGSAHEVWAQYRVDRMGRGPGVFEHVVMGPAGEPRLVTIVGHDVWRDTVDEAFSTDGRTMQWVNSVDGTQRVPHRSGFYLGVADAPLPLLARALLASPSHHIALLPTGEAVIERAGDLSVQVAGRSLTVTRYEMGGLDFAPRSIWLDSAMNLFAEVNPFGGTVRAGWESTVPMMLDAQRQAEVARYQAIALRMGHRAPSGTLAFRNATVFDAPTTQRRPHQTVVISGDRIAAVGLDGSVAIPAGAEVIDAAGKTLVPGLWDMHVHVGGGEDGLLHVAAGVTTARDLGNDSTAAQTLRREFGDHSLIGPRLLLAGLVDSPGPEQSNVGRLISSADDARAAVERYADLGYVQIKVYNSTRPELVPVLIAAAHARGLRVSGHVPAHMSATDVVTLGFDELQHANFLLQNLLSVTDFRVRARLALIGEQAADIDLRSPRAREFIALLKARGVDVDPTLAVFEDEFVVRRGQVWPSVAAVIDRFPSQSRRRYYGGGLPVPPGMDRRYRQAHETMVKLVGELYRAGVVIVAGTDGVPGFRLHRELELYVRAGIPAPIVLQIATLNAARVMHQERDYGSIEPGKIADVILVDGDPTTHIGDLDKTELTIESGIVYRAADLYGALGIAPWREPRRP